MKKLICLVLAIILSFEGSLIVMASNTISDDISIETVLFLILNTLI